MLAAMTEIYMTCPTDRVKTLKDNGKNIYFKGRWGLHSFLVIKSNKRLPEKEL